MAKDEDRQRMTLEEAVAARKQPSNMINHLVINDDDSYSLVYHIVCEFCDFCEESKCRPRRKDEPDFGADPEGEFTNPAEPHKYKPDIYERVGRD